MINILVVEDDDSIRGLLRMSLKKSGYQVDTAEDGEKALFLFEKNEYDLVLLDIMVPKIDGYELFKYIEQYHIPAIFITAKSSVEDKVKGLRMGAEDYIVKPFEILELIARIENVLKRHHKMERYIQYDNIWIDTEANIVSKEGETVELTFKEYELLLLFLKNEGIVLYRENIYERVWKNTYLADTRTVDLHVHRLRKKMGLEQAIQSIPKVGYRFCRV